MLKNYVENIANRIIQEREIANKEPYVLATDIFIAAKEDIVECMRELCREGKFKGGITVNGVPQLKQIPK